MVADASMTVALAAGFATEANRGEPSSRGVRGSAERLGAPVTAWGTRAREAVARRAAPMPDTSSASPPPRPIVTMRLKRARRWSCSAVRAGRAVRSHSSSSVTVGARDSTFADAASPSAKKRSAAVSSASRTGRGVLCSSSLTIVYGPFGSPRPLRPSGPPLPWRPPGPPRPPRPPKPLRPPGLPGSFATHALTPPGPDSHVSPTSHSSSEPQPVSALRPPSATLGLPPLVPPEARPGPTPALGGMPRPAPVPPTPPSPLESLDSPALAAASLPGAPADVSGITPSLPPHAPARLNAEAAGTSRQSAVCAVDRGYQRPGRADGRLMLAAPQSTVSTAVPLTEPRTAVMVTVPLVSPVAAPCEPPALLMAATAGVDESHVT